ncbi:MAG: SpoVA/SpoVAEb family sporulation membrane protein [Negativibacillus sp.]|nr:SpoVA/SpoVAEb family sporulation membrane protein [Negativibacillus sp.]
MTKQEYALWAQQESPRSRGAVNIAKAFVVGGLICMLGQLLIFFFEGRGAGERAPVFASICLVVLSAALTGLNVYDNLAKHAGAGTLVPITGFANSMASAAMEFKTEGYILGLGAKMFSIAGPVLVYGVGASVVYGLILLIIG